MGDDGAKWWWVDEPVRCGSRPSYAILSSDGDMIDLDDLDSRTCPVVAPPATAGLATKGARSRVGAYRYRL